MSRLRAAVKTEEWPAAAELGVQLLTQQRLGPADSVDAALLLCTALDRLGRWVELPDFTGPGIEACRQIGAPNSQLAQLLSYHGRGLYERLQYHEALQTYDQLLELFEGQEAPEAVWNVRYCRAICLERMGATGRERALAEYRELVRRYPDCQARASASARLAALLVDAGEAAEAWQVTASVYVGCAPDCQRCAGLGDVLRVMAQIELDRNNCESALELAAEALEAIPETAPSLLAMAHGVRALAELHCGHPENARSFLNLAWSYAEIRPAASVCRMLQQVEVQLAGLIGR